MTERTVIGELSQEEFVSDLSNITIGDERQTWQQLYERERAKVRDLEGCQTMLADLGRNENGRHQGDADVGDTTGASQGNPHLKTGDVIGYSLHATWKYVVPEPHQRRNPDAWRVRNTP